MLWVPTVSLWQFGWEQFCKASQINALCSTFSLFLNSRQSFNFNFVVFMFMPWRWQNVAIQRQWINQRANKFSQRNYGLSLQVMNVICLKMMRWWREKRRNSNCAWETNFHQTFSYKLLVCEEFLLDIVFYHTHKNMPQNVIWVSTSNSNHYTHCDRFLY